MRMITRKHSGKEYYYLQHSCRLDGKVKTFDRYLGTEAPKNITMQKKEFAEQINTLVLLPVFERIRTNFGIEWKRYPDSVKAKIKEQIAEFFTYNTNAIEGSSITLEETSGIIHDKIAPHKSLKDVKETEAHAQVFLAMLEKKDQLGIQLILRWHKELFGETKDDIAGVFREYMIRVGPYIAPDWQDVKKLMVEMISFYDNNKKMNPVELSARMHYRFEKIHPFGDGNGRVGRLMMNHILWHQGYPMLIIEFKKRQAYYKALQKDEEGFFKYFAKTYLMAHKRYL